jgi:hypothetical protein
MSSSYSWVSGDVSLTDAIGTTPQMNFRGFRKGYVYVPNGSSLTSLTWYASATDSGDFEACHDGSSAITNTVAADRAVSSSVLSHDLGVNGNVRTQSSSTNFRDYGTGSS